MLDCHRLRNGASHGRADDVYLLEAALPRGRKRGTNLGGMMPIVINYADARSLTPQLEPAIHAAEALETNPDLVGADVESDSDRDGCGSVQDVMHSGHVQTEFAEVAFSVGHAKMTDWLPIIRLECGFTQLDLKI